MQYSKEPTDYTGPESYVSKKLEDKKVDFFPVNQAFVLKERELQDDSEKAKLSGDVEKTKSAIQVGTLLWACLFFFKRKYFVKLFLLGFFPSLNQNPYLCLKLCLWNAESCHSSGHIGSADRGSA
jgi:hypothetical protein